MTESSHLPEETARRKALFLDYIRKFGYGRTAKAKAGIPKATLSRWKSSDPEFVEAIAEAQEDYTGSVYEVIHEAAMTRKNWAAAERILKALDRETFGNQVQHQVSGELVIAAPRAQRLSITQVDEDMPALPDVDADWNEVE